MKNIFKFLRGKIAKIIVTDNIINIERRDGQSVIFEANRNNYFIDFNVGTLGGDIERNAHGIMVVVDSNPVDFISGENYLINDIEYYSDVKGKAKIDYDDTFFELFLDLLFGDKYSDILSGILRCPICGAPMYGGVNRKKKKDGTFYKDNFTYLCKHRKESAPGVRCDYRKNWNQDIINEAVAEIIGKFVKEDKIIKKLEKYLNKSVDTSEIESEIASLEKKKKQLEGAKKNLVYKMDALDITDPYYDKKYDDMDERLDRFYQEIAAVEEEIETLNIRLDNIKSERISTEKAYQCLINFDKFYAQFTDAEKKEVLNSFVAEIHIFPERQNQRIIKSIKFKFPVKYADGVESDMIFLDKENSPETLVCLKKQG